ncbi:FAD/NAD(P)-binding protein [Halorubrum vacuolatum]|nr:FAD/NAD(P)-binding protein [Halorubrum vacuolatum]
MRTQISPRTFGCTIIGGGIHGTHLVQRLLDETPIDRSDVCIIDPHERLLASFRARATTCGMNSLRSTFVHHIGIEPFGLESFAKANGREDELVPTVNYPARPSLDLFLDHSDYVIERNDLESLHYQAAVEEIHERPETQGLRLETTAGPVETDSCVIAIGHGGRYRCPDWATNVDGIDHVWNGFTPDPDADRTIVVGGGITAAQLACHLSETQQVVLLSRHPLRWEVSEAAPPWINWSYVQDELHVHPPGSRDRFEGIREARNTATVPPYFYAEFEKREADGTLTLTQEAVESATARDGRIQLSLDCGLQLIGDQVVLATGFESVFDHPFVERVADTLDLERGYRGMPVLDDGTLAWQTDTDRSVPLYVTGALALGTVGPYASNIPGAWRAGDRISAAIRRRHRSTSDETSKEGRRSEVAH